MASGLSSLPIASIVVPFWGGYLIYIYIRSYIETWLNHENQKELQWRLKVIRAITELVHLPASHPGSGFAVQVFRAPKKHISKNGDRDIPYKPLIMKPNKVGISL